MVAMFSTPDSAVSMITGVRLSSASSRNRRSIVTPSITGML